MQSTRTYSNVQVRLFVVFLFFLWILKDIKKGNTRYTYISSTHFHCYNDMCELSKNRMSWNLLMWKYRKRLEKRAKLRRTSDDEWIAMEKSKNQNYEQKNKKYFIGNGMVYCILSGTILDNLIGLYFYCVILLISC